MPRYVPDAVCTNDIVAASKEGCVTAFSNYGEKWLNNLFTAAFGVVGEFAPSPPNAVPLTVCRNGCRAPALRCHVDQVPQGTAAVPTHRPEMGSGEHLRGPGWDVVSNLLLDRRPLEFCFGLFGIPLDIY